MAQTLNLVVVESGLLVIQTFYVVTTKNTILVACILNQKPQTSTKQLSFSLLLCCVFDEIYISCQPIIHSLVLDQSKKSRKLKILINCIFKESLI